jgi:anti-sigma factor RsiW
MMNAHLDPDLLSAYLDDEVTPDERARVSEHLTGCEACRSELEGLRFTVSLLQRLPVESPPRTFYVTEAMVTPEPRRAWWQRWRSPLLSSLGAVAALLLFMLLVQVPRFRGDTENAATTAQEAAPLAMGADTPAEETGATEATRDDAQANEAADSFEGADEEATMSQAEEAPAEEEPAAESPEMGAAPQPEGEETAGDTAASTAIEATEEPRAQEEGAVEEPAEEEAAEEEPAEEAVEEAAEAATAGEEGAAAGEAEETREGEEGVQVDTETVTEAVTATPLALTESEPVQDQDTEELPFTTEMPQPAQAGSSNRAPLLVSGVLLLLVAAFIFWRRRQG